MVKYLHSFAVCCQLPEPPRTLSLDWIELTASHEAPSFLAQTRGLPFGHNVGNVDIASSLVEAGNKRAQELFTASQKMR